MKKLVAMIVVAGGLFTYISGYAHPLFAQLEEQDSLPSQRVNQQQAPIEYDAGKVIRQIQWQDLQKNSPRPWENRWTMNYYSWLNTGTQVAERDTFSGQSVLDATDSMVEEADKHS